MSELVEARKILMKMLLAPDLNSNDAWDRGYRNGVRQSIEVIDALLKKEAERV